MNADLVVDLRPEQIAGIRNFDRQQFSDADFSSSDQEWSLPST
jgi:hypothetical protein